MVKVVACHALRESSITRYPISFLGCCSSIKIAVLLHFATSMVLFRCVLLLLQVFGSLAVVTSTFQDGHVLSQHTQPKKKRFAMVNVALAAAILFTGSSRTQVLRLFQCWHRVLQQANVQPAPEGYFDSSRSHGEHDVSCCLCQPFSPKYQDGYLELLRISVAFFQCPVLRIWTIICRTTLPISAVVWLEALLQCSNCLFETFCLISRPRALHIYFYIYLSFQPWQHEQNSLYHKLLKQDWCHTVR